MTADVGAGTGIAGFEGWKHVLLRRMRNPTNESPDSLMPATKCLGSTVVLYNSQESDGKLERLRSLIGVQIVAVYIYR